MKEMRIKRQISYDIDKKETARRLKEAMADIGITAVELSEKSKISKSSISQYYNARQCCSNLSANAMAKVLGVNPMWLMGFDVPKYELELEMDLKTNDEAEFIELYRNLNDDERNKVRSFMRFIRYYEEMKKFMPPTHEPKSFDELL